MYVFMEFYRGDTTSAVMNIDHDTLVELIFEALPKVKMDADWSFSVGRYKELT